MTKVASKQARYSVLLLSGMVYCDKCGARMTIKTVVYKDGHKGWSVLCTNRHETGNCDQKICVLSEDFFDGLYQRVVRIDDNLQWQLQEHDKELTKYRETLVIKEKN